MAHSGLARKKSRLELLLKNIQEERRDQLPGDHPDLAALSLDDTSCSVDLLKKRIERVDRNLHLVKIKSWRETIDWHMSLYACFRHSFSSTSYVEPFVGSIGVAHGILGLYRLSLKYTLDDNWLDDNTD
jgi:hypothetical protein